MVLAQFDLGSSIQNALDTFFDWLPNLVAALVILLIGYFVAKLIAGIVRRVAGRTGLDERYRRSDNMSYLQRFIEQPSGILGTVGFWLVFLTALSWSLAALDSGAVDGFVAAIWNYVPHIIAAAVIFIVAAAISAGVAAFSRRTLGDSPLGRIVSTAAPILVMTIATFMILTELQLAETIVMITYAGLIGAVALGSALAFGLGGREVAGRMLSSAYQSGRESSDQFKRDWEQGTERARQDAERARDQARDGGGDRERERIGADGPMTREREAGERDVEPARGETARTSPLR